MDRSGARSCTRPAGAWWRSGARTTATARRRVLRLTPPTTCPKGLLVVELCAALRAHRPIPISRASSRRPTACSARCATCSGSMPPAPATRARGFATARGPRASSRCAAISTPRRRARRTRDRLRVRARRGRRRARDPRGPDPRRHHRARPLPLLDRRREGAAPRGAPGLHAQGHRQALRRTSRVAEGYRLAGRVSGDSTVAYRVGLRAGRRVAARRRSRRRARAGCARCCSSASASPTTWATWARSATTPRFGFALAQFMRLKEDWLRANARGVRPSLR